MTVETTIIIPAYNAERWLKRAIDSVLSQTAQNIEIIVIDDGSRDKTADICLEYGDLVKYVLQNNSGVSAARNKGIELAKGEFVGFLDADDELMPNMVGLLKKAFSAFPGVAAVSGAHFHDTGKARIRRPSVGRVLHSSQIMGEFTDFFEIYRKLHTVVWTGSVLFRQYVFSEIGGFRPGLNFGEDTDMWVRVAGKFRWAFVDEPVAIYHHVPESSRTLLVSASDKSLSALFGEQDMRKCINADLWQSYRRFRRDRASSFARILLSEGQKDLAKQALDMIPPAPISINWLLTKLLFFLPHPLCKYLRKARRSFRKDQNERS